MQYTYFYIFHPSSHSFPQLISYIVPPPPALLPNYRHFIVVLIFVQLINLPISPPSSPLPPFSPPLSPLFPPIYPSISPPTSTPPPPPPPALLLILLQSTIRVYSSTMIIIKIIGLNFGDISTHQWSAYHSPPHESRDIVTAVGSF